MALMESVVGLYWKASMLRWRPTNMYFQPETSGETKDREGFSGRVIKQQVYSPPPRSAQCSCHHRSPRSSPDRIGVI